MSKYQNIGDELPDSVPAQPVKAKKKSPYNQPIHFNNGVASFVMFLLFLFLGYLGFKQNMDFINDIVNSMRTSLSTGNYNSIEKMDYGNMMSGQLMMLGAVICYILSLSFAGASLAKSQSSILGLFVLVLSLAPWVYSFVALPLELPSISSILFQL